jgi:hypothetical protein
MSNFIQARQPDTPRLLYHYTKPDNVISMLDVGKKSICFWLKNNKDKNDKKELRYGRELMEKVRAYYRSKGHPSILDQMTDFDNSYSASFTEGVLDAHMLKEYGTARLEFDLRDFKDEDIYKCEYYTEEDLAELYQVMIADIQSMEGITKESSDDLKLRKLFGQFTLEMDLKAKIGSIKLKNEWETEGEWRYVLHKQENDERYFHDSDGLERLKMFIPIKHLTGIALLYDDNTKEEMKVLSKRIKDIRNWNRFGRFNVKIMRINNQI